VFNDQPQFHGGNNALAQPGRQSSIMSESGLQTQCRREAQPVRRSKGDCCTRNAECGIPKQLSFFACVPGRRHGWGPGREAGAKRFRDSTLFPFQKGMNTVMVSAWIRKH
jgi:hypothetical protein